MKTRILTTLIAVVALIGYTGCADTGALETKLNEQKQMLTDTVGYYGGVIDSLNARIESMQEELDALTSVSSISNSTTSGGTKPQSSANTSGTIDVTDRGKSAGDDGNKEIDVTTRGKSSAGSDDGDKKIDVNQRGKSNKDGGE